MDFEELLDEWDSSESGPNDLERFMANNCGGLSAEELLAFKEQAKELKEFDHQNNPPVIQPGREPLLKAGKEYRKYKVEEPLGAGGAGTVFAARNSIGERVALKEIELDRQPEGVEERALELMENVDHPNLIAINDHWTDDLRLVIVMECADGGNLDERLEHYKEKGYKGLPRDELLQYMKQTADALDYLIDPPDEERDSLVHRDIKPQNILLSAGSVKVTDFGLMKVLKETTASHSGQLTPRFSAPEFFDEKFERQSDQYSLAVTYCYLRGGSLPVKGETPAAIMKSHLSDPPDLEMVPSGEREVLERALEKEPSGRWDSCTKFIEELEIASDDPESKKWHRSSSKTKKGSGLVADPRDAILYLVAFGVFIVFVLLYFVFVIK